MSPSTTLRKNQEIELTVDQLALGGKAIGRYEGMVVFVDGALPGDRVRARVTRRRKQYAEARALERLDSRIERVPAPCNHFAQRECGGCRFQDLPYPDQLATKRDQVVDTLTHLGGFESPPVEEIVPCDDPFRYRNKMEFTFHPDRDGTPMLGLHRRHRFDRVFDLEECWIATPLTSEIARQTRAFARRHGWAAYDGVAHTGVVRFLVVRHLVLSDQVMVNLVAADGQIPRVVEWAEEVAALDRRIRSVVLNRNTSRANVAQGEPGRQEVLHGGRTIEERLHGLVFQVSANTFLQTNSRQAERLYQAALEACALTGSERVLDVYCGAGTISLLLARHASEVIGIEVVESAVEEARANAARCGAANARFVAGEARLRMRDGSVPWTPDVILVDPPRAGLHPKVVTAIVEMAPRRLVYVSCNPATLARDLASFRAARYTLEGVRPFDLFPHTPHIETVSRLARSGE